jgi:hypothetical protein
VRGAAGGSLASRNALAHGRAMPGRAVALELCAAATGASLFGMLSQDARF